MAFPVDTGSIGQDGSGSITTGGVAQNLFGGETPSKGFSVFNNNSTVSIFVKIGATASGSAGIEIAPKGLYESPSGLRPYGVISIFSSLTGHQFTAFRW